jgi:hypothetical protein
MVQLFKDLMILLFSKNSSVFLKKILEVSKPICHGIFCSFKVLFIIFPILFMGLDKGKVQNASDTSDRTYQLLGLKCSGGLK